MKLLFLFGLSACCNAFTTVRGESEEELMRSDRSFSGVIGYEYVI